MSRQAEWHEVNIRIRRICPEAFVTFTRERAYSQRWCAWERMTIPLTTDENLLSAPGMTKDTEAIVCAAPTPHELLHKYGLIKSGQRREDAMRESGGNPPTSWRVLFRDRVLRGEESMPPPDPPEWAEYRKMQAAQVRESAERTVEQVRATTRNFMALQNIMPDAKTKRLLGIGRGEGWHK